MPRTTISAEERGLQRATVRYLRRPPSKRQAPFTWRWMLRLHREVFGHAWPHAGRIRKSRPDFGVKSSQVLVQLKQLADNTHVWEHDPIEASADLHVEAVRIHPFADGNGRWARLLSNIWLRQKTGEVVEWPLEVREDGFRDEYIDAIEAAVDETNYAPLYSLHRRFVKLLGA